MIWFQLCQLCWLPFQTMVGIITNGRPVSHRSGTLRWISLTRDRIFQQLVIVKWKPRLVSRVFPGGLNLSKKSFTDESCKLRIEPFFDQSFALPPTQPNHTTNVITNGKTLLNMVVGLSLNCCYSHIDLFHWYINPPAAGRGLWQAPVVFFLSLFPGIT